MLNEKYNLNRLNNAEDLKEIIKFCIKKYGSFVSLKAMVEETDYQSYYDYEDSTLNAIDFGKVKQFMITIISDNKEVIVIRASVKDKILTVKGLSDKVIVSNKYAKVDNPMNYIDDQSCYYYMFENKVMVKFDPKESIYYTLDEQQKWLRNNAPISWMYDNNKGYDIIFSPGRSRK